jgi:hypothetical protein
LGSLLKTWMTGAACCCAMLASSTLLAPAPAAAADSNTLTLVGNVTSVSQTTHPGQPAKSGMAIAVLAGMPDGVTTPLRISMECTAAMDCYDSWWLSSGCTASYASASIDFSGGLFQSYSCSNPHTYGACVEVIGHLWTDDQGYLLVVPETINALPSYDCSSKS